MFLDSLNDAQREQVVILAHRLTAADGEDAVDEEEALRQLKAEAGYNHAVPMDRVLGELDVSAFDTRQAKTAAMLQILVLAFTDEHLHPAESKFLGQLAGAMDLSQDEFNPMVNWAYQYGTAVRSGDTGGQENLLRQARALIDAGV